MRAGEEKHTHTQKGPHLVAARELAGKAIQLLEPEDVPVPEPEHNLRRRREGAPHRQNWPRRQEGGSGYELTQPVQAVRYVNQMIFFHFLLPKIPIFEEESGKLIQNLGESHCNSAFSRTYVKIREHLTS